LRGDRLDEAALLAECGRLIRERDPDVLEGHNIFRFDLEYLEARARRHGVTLAWGRDGSALRGRPARLQVAERAIGFRRYDVAGRHIVDTWMLAQLHDVGARDLPSFGLKDIARHLGVAATDRTYVDASNVARQLAEDADRLMAYAGDDALETLAISAILSPPFFAQARLVPFDYQSTTLRGSAAKVDALLLREYLRAGRAVPRPRPGQSVGGGLTAIWQQGVAAPVLHVDVTSLYPSLMIGGRVAPACDELGVFLDLLTHLRDVRVAAKRQAQAADTEEERRHQLALSQSFKILINSFYGYLGFSSAHWNDFEAANRVTTEGRAVVTSIVERLQTLGATPVEADTDGVYFTPPPGHRAEDDARLLAMVAEKLPPGITLELDGRYPAMFSYKMKTYALLDDRGRVTLKGSAFRSRAATPRPWSIAGSANSRRTACPCATSRARRHFKNHLKSIASASPRGCGPPPPRTSWRRRAPGRCSLGIRSRTTSRDARRVSPSPTSRSWRRSGIPRGRTRTWSITSPRCSRRGSASAASPSTTVSCRMSTTHRSRRS